LKAGSFHFAIERRPRRQGADDEANPGILSIAVYKQMAVFKGDGLPFQAGTRLNSITWVPAMRTSTLSCRFNGRNVWLPRKISS